LIIKFGNDDNNIVDDIDKEMEKMESNKYLDENNNIKPGLLLIPVIDIPSLLALGFRCSGLLDIGRSISFSQALHFLFATLIK
jgi:hypothetical protein